MTQNYELKEELIIEETHDDVIRQKKLPRVGQTVRSKKYGALWRVIEKRKSGKIPRMIRKKATRV